MKKTLFIILVLTGLSSTLRAQHVEGTITDANTSQPIPFASVALLKAADSTLVRGTTTDDKGSFYLTVALDSSQSDCLLRLSALGYETACLRLDSSMLASSDTTSATLPNLFPLIPTSSLLEGVTITAKRPVYSVDGEKDLYNVAEDASIQTGNASDALQNAPGVEVDVQGNVTLNGRSVEVWINDRPSHLDGEPLRQYIKMLPANSIDRIEVMKNPSAKYGGGAPVVNIITNQRILLNSFLSVGLTGSSQPSITPFVSYAYSNEKFHLSAYLNYNGKRTPEHTESSGHLLDQDSLLSREWSSVSDHTWSSKMLFASINASYDFDKHNSLSGWIGTYPMWIPTDMAADVTRTEYFDAPSDYSYHYSAVSDQLSYGGYAGIDFVHKFNDDGHKLTLGYSGSLSGYRGDNQNSATYFHQPQMSYDQNSIFKQHNGHGALSLDYTLPYSKKGEVEAGLSYQHGLSYYYSHHDIMYHTLGYYEVDALRSDTNHTPSHRVSSYLSWRRKWGSFTCKIGGRLSYSHSYNYHEGLPQYDVTASNWSFSPSLHLSYRTENMHNFSASYRYRTSHPSVSSLSSYIDYGIESASTGNPLLQPQYEHTASLSWNKYFSKFGSVGISADYEADLDEYNTINDARYVDLFGRVVEYAMPYNNADGRRLTLNANCMYRPTGFLNIRLEAGLADDWYRITPRVGEPAIEDEMLAFNLRGKMWTKLWKKVEIFVSGYYNTPAHGSSKLVINHERKGIDLGMSADLFDRKLSLYFNLRDIFDWDISGTTNINPYNSSTSTEKQKSRFLTFGATLRFGKMELEYKALSAQVPRS